MVMLVTLEQASVHLRRDTTDDDDDVINIIKAASLSVLNYISDHSFLDSSGLPDYDSSGTPMNVPEPIQQAVLIITGMFYKNRDGVEFVNDNAGMERLGNIILPRVVHFLLDPYRTPVIS